MRVGMIGIRHGHVSSDIIESTTIDSVITRYIGCTKLKRHCNRLLNRLNSLRLGLSPTKCEKIVTSYLRLHQFLDPSLMTYYVVSGQRTTETDAQT